MCFNQWSAYRLSFCSCASQGAHSDVASAKTLNTLCSSPALHRGVGGKNEGRVRDAEGGQESISLLSIGRLYRTTYFTPPPPPPLPRRAPLWDADTQIIIKEDDCHAGADLQPSWANQSQKLRWTVKASGSLASDHSLPSSSELHLLFQFPPTSASPPPPVFLYILIRAPNERGGL